MSVKTIFKALLGTVIIIVVSSVIIELFNVMIYSTRIASLSKIAANQSAELFSQESYKHESGSRTSNLSNIKYSAGVSDDGNIYGSGTYVSGKIYDNLDTFSIWLDLYTSDPYKDFVNDYGNNWYSLKIMDKALSSNITIPSSPPAWNDTAAQQEYLETSLAYMYRTNHYTPLNMGIPYIGEYGSSAAKSYNRNSELDKMFVWNLTQLLSNCNPNNIRKDANGDMYVMYNGFRCYTKEAAITNVEYEVFNVTTSAGKNAFKKLTSIDASKLSIASNDLSNLTTTIGSGSNKRDERTNICVAYIEYSLPVSYKGITPISNIYEWIWNNETRVDGYKDTAPTYTEQSWSDKAEILEGGGKGNNSLPTSGTLVYYIVR